MKLKKPVPKLQRDAFRVAMGRALARAIRSGESYANRTIRKEYSISRAAVDAGLTSRIDSVSKLKGKVSAKGQRLPIIQFIAGSNPFRSRGIAVRITKNRKQLVRGSRGNPAFAAMMPGGHVGIYERTGKKRLHITEITTLSIADMFKGLKVMGPLEKFIEERLKIELDHQTTFALKQLANNSLPDTFRKG